ncbi:glycosyltransferase involved in cell wall biosynthesis [Angulomicrobium tetraedrale]|uniref:Glycosyltransferase involved in cell wall biosynthesis n=1 Tax=Ancylobacter tetraedralis TaxID=217068 RepID=A0A839ZDA6_9HYPH|nr:glycosyltransferase family 4 protein [Ancylobacter tetraedralis]MBB3772622.1 glycosyltransferase involved in cell wall biosynthesis [Ancylobacter tetraedralis]
MRCLFLAPLKAPDHPVPSGERTMARLFLRLLERLGYTVELASDLTSFAPDPDPARWPALDERARAEIRRLVARHGEERIACVFTYHVYYKAPDLIGPGLAAALGVPYVIAEPSRAPKRASGPFAEGHARAEAAIAAAGLLLPPTAADRDMLDRLKSPQQRIFDLKPFIDPAEWPNPRRDRAISKSRPVRLLTVAMMRPGDKLTSYRQLGAALAGLEGDGWTLDVVGDGPVRAEVEAALAPLGARVRFRGGIAGRAALGEMFSAADLFVWPGVNEAFGVVYLEAQAHGLPCVAGNHGGIADAVKAGETALLTPPGDIPAFRASVAQLIADGDRRRAMGEAAARFIGAERTLAAAATTLAQAFRASGIALPETAA